MNQLDDLRTDPAHLEMLRAHLADTAGDEVEVAYRTVDSPVGELLLATTTSGLVRVAFELEDFDTALVMLAAQISPRVLHAPGRLDEAARSLEEYFTGRLRAFELPLDRSLSRGFRARVHEYLPSIPFGSTESYGQVAEHVGNPRAVRAVGTACAMNPLPIVVPCHRVLRSDGTIGAYLGGTEAKQTLLDLESGTR